MTTRTGTERIDNTEDTIDSRDVIARIEELEDEHADCDGNQAVGDCQDADEHAELVDLRALADQCEGYGDWEYGVPLIRDSAFEDYAREMASDLYGREIDEARWPFDCIDWEQAARELRVDYTAVEFDGVTYWMRS